MSDVDAVVQRTIDQIVRLSKFGSRFAGRVVIAATLICIGSFAAGIAALSGGIETVWIVLATTFAAIAIGGSLLAWWRVRAIRRHVPQLADEVRQLARDGYGTGNTVIETFEVGDASASTAIVMSRQMSGLRSSLGGGLVTTRRLAQATRALTTFPFLILASIVITITFAFLGLIFLLALALS